MPLIHFLPKVIPDPEQKKMPKIEGANSTSDSSDETDKNSQKKYKCPVYKTSVRAGTLSTTGQSTNYILAIDIPMSVAGRQDHWALRGTALITMLND